MIKNLKGKLIVSCQALENEPLHSSFIMGRMALAAKEGGASAIRANSVEDINEIKKTTNLPVIGIIKRDYEDSEIYITASKREVKELLETEVEIIALDCTNRKRPNNESLKELIDMMHEEGALVMADISTYEEGVEAEKLGVDIVSTTLSGYTPYTKKIEGPDFELLEKLVKDLKTPVFCEGRINTPEEAKKALELGAYSVIVGGAITRPVGITERFINAIN
ncbi:MAG: N-acetylmannosamine-6-phosphate 2-epimerase [Clostridium sp.]